MSGDHESPCPALRQHQQDSKEAGRQVQGHERELGGIAAKLETIIAGQKKLFDRTDELCGITVDNKANIQRISDEQQELKEQIGNGLKVEIAKEVLNHVRREDELPKFLSPTPSPDPEIEKRLKELESVSWFPKLMDLSLKKIVGWALVALIIVSILNATTWGVLKWVGFGEKPGLMKGLAVDHSVMVDPRVHSHTDLLGKTIIHSHEIPDGDPIQPNGTTK